MRVIHTHTHTHTHTRTHTPKYTHCFHFLRHSLLSFDTMCVAFSPADLGKYHLIDSVERVGSSLSPTSIDSVRQPHVVNRLLPGG
jgi:hypothetical protein